MVANSNEYFATLETAQRFDLLRHLIENSELVPLVRGPEGIGKSLLAERLQREAPDNWVVCRFEADPRLTPERLLQQITRCLGGAERSDDPLQGLIEHLESMREGGITPVLLVDDAQQLPPTSLINLLRLYERQLTGNPLVSIVLFANERIDELLSTPQLQIMSPQAIQVIDLLPFSLEDATGYMHFLLKAEGLPADLELDDQRLAICYRESGGLPGPLRQCILQALGEGEPRPPAQHGGQTGRWWVAVPLLLLVAGGLVFQDDINHWFTPTAQPPREGPGRPPAQPPAAREGLNGGVTLEHSQRIAPPAQEERSAVVTRPLAEERPPAGPGPVETQRQRPPTEKPARVELAPPLADGSPATTPAAPERPPEMPEIARLPEPRKQTEAPPAPAPAEPGANSSPPAEGPAAGPLGASGGQPAEPIGPASPVPGSARTQPSPAVPEAAGQGAAKPPPQDPLHRDEWVLARPPGHYTLQLLGVEDLAELKDFIRRHQLQGELFYIKTWRNGRPWYPLLFGEFTDKQGALEAKRRLRGKLQRQDAWPRPFAALQAILKRSG